MITHTTITSREFNQDVARAKRHAAKGPVFITDRGHPAHVLMTVEEYQKITGCQETIVESLAMPEAVEFEPTPLKGPLARPADFS